MHFYELSACVIAEGVKTKKFSALEVFEAALNRSILCENKLSALITTSVEAGREQAKHIDALVAEGKDPGPLAGVPVVLKDNICTRGIRTTAGSRILGQWTPPYDATVWNVLHNAGAVLLGKANMDEFAMGNTCESSAFGPTFNPWDVTLVPGGSSGGSATAVAAGYVPVALGSDTGGSIRQPASYCGIYGLKPTYGLVSRYGVIAYGSSLDQVGPLARSVKDISLAMKVLACHDPKDSTSVAGKVFKFDGLPASLKGKRIALVKEFNDFSVDPDIAEAMKRVVNLLEQAGATVCEVSLPTVARYAVACYYAIAASEANTNLARYDGVRLGYTVDSPSGIKSMFEEVRTGGFGHEVKMRILAGTCLTEPERSEDYYVAATKVRTLIAEEFRDVFDKVDHILQPVTPALPGKVGQSEVNALKGYESDLYTLPVNMAGLPGFSFLTGYTKAGLPVGLQLVGARWSDEALLNTGAALEEILGSPRVAMGGA